MKNKIADSLPKKLPGSVCAQMVRCGKPTCKCARGELHGPYFYHFVWEGGRQRKVYVKKEEVEQMRLACESYREERRAWRAECLANNLSARALMKRFVELQKEIAALTGILTK